MKVIRSDCQVFRTQSIRINATYIAINSTSTIRTKQRHIGRTTMHAHIHIYVITNYRNLNLFLDCVRKPEYPHMQTRCRKTTVWDSNQGPSCYNATELPTVLWCSPEYMRNLLSRSVLETFLQAQNHTFFLKLIISVAQVPVFLTLPLYHSSLIICK